MILHPPFKISARLMPALEIAGATLSLQCGDYDQDGRTRYQVWIDLPDGSEYAIEDMRSGCQGGSVLEGFSALLSFLGAAAESYAYSRHTGHPSENADLTATRYTAYLFPPAVVEWADGCSDELSMLQCVIEESASPLIEE